MLFVKLLAMEDQTITAGQVIVRGGAGQGIGPSAFGSKPE